jgi:hypothetical protein
LVESPSNQREQRISRILQSSKDGDVLKFSCIAGACGFVAGIVLTVFFQKCCSKDGDGVEGGLKAAGGALNKINSCFEKAN